jgi:predicted dithiol-disulfide oxidoreductase (DUF899 family)
VSDAQVGMRLPGESDEYRLARTRLLEAEVQLRRQIEAVAAERRRLPLGGEVPLDYTFEEAPGMDVALSELFAPGKDTLFLYSFMFLPDGDRPLGRACPSCTSIVDSLDSAAPHIAQRVNIAVSAKAPIAQFREHAATRGWRHIRLLSSAASTYNKDYGTETPEGGQLPVATVFVRRAAKIHHFWSSELFAGPRDPGEHPRHVDFMWPVWSVFDTTPDGRGTNWELQLSYD